MKKEKGEYYLYLGRLEEIKGIKLLIDAFRRMPDKRLLIAGDGPCSQEYKNYAKDCCNIEFLGYVARKQVF